MVRSFVFQAVRMTQKASLKIAASAARSLTPPTGGLFNSRCGIFSAGQVMVRKALSRCHVAESGRCRLISKTKQILIQGA